MKVFSWNEEKNALLRAERQVCFENVVIGIELGYLNDILEHPNQEKYAGRKNFVVEIENYIYLVPFIESDSEVFLKTIIPSRKATKRYLLLLA